MVRGSDIFRAILNSQGFRVQGLGTDTLVPLVGILGGMKGCRVKGLGSGSGQLLILEILPDIAILLSVIPKVCIRDV